jgi:hypothetical protein
MNHRRKTQVSSGGRKPGFALLLAGVLANGLREWQRNNVARRDEVETSDCSAAGGPDLSELAQCESKIRDYR